MDNDADRLARILKRLLIAFDDCLILRGWSTGCEHWADVRELQDAMNAGWAILTELSEPKPEEIDG